RSCALLAAYRREGDEQTAVVVVRREHVGDDGLGDARARRDRELLTESADAPLAGELDRLRIGELQRLDDVTAHQVGLRETSELEDAPARREHAPVTVGDDKARVGSGVVVVEQLEEEAEAAVAARRGLLRKALLRVDVDRALLAAWADEVRHGGPA